MWGMGFSPADTDLLVCAKEEAKLACPYFVAYIL